MTAPNYFGWTDDRVAMRWEEHKARALAAELKPQMDEFLDAIGAAYDIPDDFGHASEPADEREQQAAECRTIDDWLQPADRAALASGDADLLNWHNRVVFNVPAICENIQTTSHKLKSRIDARMQAARDRLHFDH